VITCFRVAQFYNAEYQKILAQFLSEIVAPGGIVVTESFNQDYFVEELARLLEVRKVGYYLFCEKPFTRKRL